MVHHEERREAGKRLGQDRTMRRERRGGLDFERLIIAVLSKMGRISLNSLSLNTLCI